MCIMKGITERQREILNYIQSFLRQNAYWPSIRDIQNHFGFKSTNAVMGHLRALERKQILNRIPGQARTFKFVDFGMDFPNQPKEMLNIPIYGSIAAGYPDRVEASGEIGRLQIDIETAGIRPGQNAFALKVRGESMMDVGILDGDTVVIQPGLARDGDIVAALIDGETTLKRYIQKPGTTPYLKAENEDYPELYPITELIVQGICKAVIRNL
jgi:repressor LexA